MFMIYNGGIQSIAIHDGLSRHTPSSNWVCHSTNYSNLLSAPKKLHLTHRTKEFVQAQQELLEAGTPQVEENAESLLKSIQEVVCYTCIDARAKTVLVSSRKKETVESKSQ